MSPHLTTVWTQSRKRLTQRFRLQNYLELSTQRLLPQVSCTDDRNWRDDGGSRKRLRTRRSISQPFIEKRRWPGGEEQSVGRDP